MTDDWVTVKDTCATCGGEFKHWIAAKHEWQCICGNTADDSYVEQDLMVEDYRLTREAARLLRSEALIKNCQRRWTQLVSAAKTDAYLALLVAQLKPPPVMTTVPAAVEGQRQISLDDEQQ